MDESQPIGTIIQDRYEILGLLGRGGNGITYRVIDATTDQHMALKELSLRGLSDWKKLELFEREAQVLKSLEHPGIPKYADAFQVDTADNRYFYLVQALAEGRSLADRVAEGEHFPEAEVQCIAVELLQILKYLHGHTPPIIHRDIKPQNVILREDGTVFLVDFGAVQAVYHETVAFGSTIVGTYGYMAPEQFRGQAYPATDLYGLGMTLLYLLTHKHPGDLPEERLKVDFRPHVTVSERFGNWLDGLIEPVVSDRFDSAETAYLILTASGANPYLIKPPKAPIVIDSAPEGSQIKVTRSQHELVVEIPPLIRGRAAMIIGRGIGNTVSRCCRSLGGSLRLMNETFSFPLVFLTGLIGWSLIRAHGGQITFLGLFLAVALAASLIWILARLWVKTKLIIKPDHFTLSNRCLFMEEYYIGNTRDIKQVHFDPYRYGNDALLLSKPRSDTPISLYEPDQRHTLGRLLTIEEKEWLSQQIDAFLLALD